MLEQRTVFNFRDGLVLYIHPLLQRGYGGEDGISCTGQLVFLSVLGDDMEIDRFRVNELSVGRVAEAVYRRAADLPHALAWRLRTEAAESNRRGLSGFQNRHAGERCFIMANGPSLTKIDLSKLASETTFGMNRIYLIEDDLGFSPTYYVCINELILDQFWEEISRLQMPSFLNWNRRGYFSGDEDTYFLRFRLGLRDVFGEDLKAPISSGGTVTYAALQVAYYMGFQQAILVGLDHNYDAQGTPNRTAVRSQETDVDHFHPEYFPKGSKWQPPDLLRSELAYQTARRAYETAGREIIDATPGGKCEVFEKRDYESLFDRGH